MLATGSGQPRRSSVHVSVTSVPPGTAAKRYSQVAIGPRTHGRRRPMAWTLKRNTSSGSAAVTVQRVVQRNGPRLLWPSKTIPTRVAVPGPSAGVAPRFSGLQRPMRAGSETCW